MTFKLLRRGSARCVGLLSAFVTILLCLYYISIGQPNMPPNKDTTSNMGLTSMLKEDMVRQRVRSNSERTTIKHKHNAQVALPQQQQLQRRYVNKMSTTKAAISGNIVRDNEATAWDDKCYILDVSVTNITAYDEYSKFDFQPEWIKTKEFWDRGFEERYEVQKKDKQRPPLKVFVMPHSHNDPGWLRTFLNYFESDSRQILNLMVTKMQEFTDMTFIWSEISFLQLWWDQAHPTKQRALKQLIKSGRFEITTGGWVMTDEANVHLYAMLDQLIEGHQWLRNTLNVTPTVGWSIDPFGHGSTVPYLLSGSNFEGTIIQRIHYAWKLWFARQQQGDFLWTPYWQKQNQKSEATKGTMLTHNMPFDIYSIKGSCGPHPFICLNFDFRKIAGEYTEYSIKAQFITDENLEEKAQLLLEQYARTASLFPHNVALIPVGDDFRYNKEREVYQQYTNYKKLIDHIMANKRLYNVDISFGTPKDYFAEIRKRSASFPTFKGDFFVYSDIFSEGHPAYWSGYFTTRPFYKILSSDLEHNLRAAEILFTIAYNTAKQHYDENALKIFEKNYEKLIHARRNLGLFQHHDAITGTSKFAVMRDYGMRLFQSIQDSVKMQESTIELLIQNNTSNYHKFLLSELERDNFTKLPRKTPIQFVSLDRNQPEIGATSHFVIYNSLAQRRLEVVTLRTSEPNIKLYNERGQEIRNLQINPVWNITDTYEYSGLGLGTGGATPRMRISNRQYEVMFVADLPALSLSTYRLVLSEAINKHDMAIIYCDECTESSSSTSNPKLNADDVVMNFSVKSKPAGDIQLENNKMRLLFDEKTGFLKTVTRKNKQGQLRRPMQCALNFAAYRSAQFHSGAYLFKTDPEQSEAEKDVLDQYSEVRIIITSGQIASDVTVVYGPFLAHTVRIFNTHTHLDAAIYIENDIDFEQPPKNRETELFMRFVTDIDNVERIGNDADKTKELPVFYTDQNGFQYHKRTKVPAIGIEGNYFPITTAAFMQDSQTRFSILTTHAQGSASYEPGQLEVMLDRRTLYDDYRGMGEGVVDSRLTRHKFWVIIEDMPTQPKNGYQVPSLFATHMANGLRYPPNLYFIDTLEAPTLQLKSQALLLSAGNLPCDVHLLNLRTLSEQQLQLFPSSSALLVLQRQGYDCAVGQHVEFATLCADAAGLAELQLNNLNLECLESTSLTAMLPAHKRQRLRSFADIKLEPMELQTFNVTFSV